MNDKERKIFGEVLDLNFEMSQENRNFARKLDLQNKLVAKQLELKKEMGDDEYNKFMNMGKKMFAPKQS